MGHWVNGRHDVKCGDNNQQVGLCKHLKHGRHKTCQGCCSIAAVFFVYRQSFNVSIGVDEASRPDQWCHTYFVVFFSSHRPPAWCCVVSPKLTKIRVGFGVYPPQGQSRVPVGEISSSSLVETASSPPDHRSLTSLAQPRTSFGVLSSTDTQSKAGIGLGNLILRTPPPPPVMVLVPV